LQGISGIKEAYAERLKGNLGEGEPDPSVYDHLGRAKLFYTLILEKIVARRVPLYQKQWASV